MQLLDIQDNYVWGIPISAIPELISNYPRIVVSPGALSGLRRFGRIESPKTEVKLLVGRKKAAIYWEVVATWSDLVTEVQLYRKTSTRGSDIRGRQNEHCLQFSN